MATRIENILTRARDTLADPNASRWSDDRLLRILDEGHKDLAKQTKILKGQHTILVEFGVHTYTLPDNLWLITRAAYADAEIELVSYDSMDKRADQERVGRRPQHHHTRGYSGNEDYNRLWTLDEGSEITALVYDNRNLHDIRVYPIPGLGIADHNYEFVNARATEYQPLGVYELDTPYGVISQVVGAHEDVQPPFGVITEVTEEYIELTEYDGDELLGIVTDITGYTFSSAHGFAVDLYDPEVIAETSDTYGVVTDIDEASNAVNIWYIRVPDTLSSVNDELETPTMFDIALKHYVVGHAFRDDLDVQYRDMAAESIRLYGRELELAQETNRSDGTRNPGIYRSTYRGAFE